MPASPSNALLLSAVEAIYDAAPDPSRWPRALACIADCFDDVGAVLLWQRDDSSFGTIVSDSLLDAQRCYDDDGWSVKDIRAIRSVERGYLFSGEPFTDRHLCSAAEIQTDPTYTQFAARHGLGFVAAIAVSPDANVGVGLSVQRNACLKPPFSDDELDVLGRLGEHVEKSLRLSIRLLNTDLTSVSLGDALARIGIGVFALDARGRVVFSNPAGNELLGDRLSIAQDRLRIGVGAEREVVDAAIGRVLNNGPLDLVSIPRPLLIQQTDQHGPLVIYILPLAKPPSIAEHFLTRTRAIVLAISPRIGEPADPTLVRDVLGITLGEARVAAMIGAGMPPREAADQLGIAEVTARNVLKRVFAKVGVSRQSELVALLSKLVMR